jgi:hypothetical protein
LKVSGGTGELGLGYNLLEPLKTKLGDRLAVSVAFEVSLAV